MEQDRNRTEIVTENGKKKKALILNTDMWAKWLAGPNERGWIKLIAMKQGYDIIKYKNKEYWRRNK